MQRRCRSFACQSVGRSVYKAAAGKATGQANVEGSLFSHGLKTAAPSNIDELIARLDSHIDISSERTLSDTTQRAQEIRRVTLGAKHCPSASGNPLLTPNSCDHARESEVVGQRSFAKLTTGSCSLISCQPTIWEG